MRKIGLIEESARIGETPTHLTACADGSQGAVTRSSAEPTDRVVETLKIVVDV